MSDAVKGYGPRSPVSAIRECPQSCVHLQKLNDHYDAIRVEDQNTIRTASSACCKFDAFRISPKFAEVAEVVFPPVRLVVPKRLNTCAFNSILRWSRTKIGRVTKRSKLLNRLLLICDAGM